MNKNLKKVISAVIALALSVGSAAMAAPSFTDVAETASYAQAVNTLAALGVIAGYEDGTFKPDSNITRAEVATMVVAALNRSADAEGAKGTTKFDDVNTDAKAWASGFVNIGVSEGFISGYDDGSFKPDNNVTYAEMVSMLVRVAGYGRYAEYLGGWPNGYLSVGNDKGVTKGVSAGADVAVTRAQVAQMIYNTLMDVPVVESTTLTTDSNGNLVPEMTIMDGKGDNDYKTLLTEKHNAYYVEGSVTKTNRTNPTECDADEVEFTIEYTENYDDSDIVIKKGDDKTSAEYVYVGETDAANYLFTYASAIIKIDDNDDATLVSFVPSGKNDIVSLDTTLIDDEDYESGYNNGNTIFGNPKPYVKFYATKDASKSTKYSLAYDSNGNPDFRLFVNGVEISANQDNFEYYVLNNDTGKVELIDCYSASQKADGKYDIISATFYATAKIGSINASTGKVAFNKSFNNGRSNSIELDDENDDLTYEILYNGEKIERSALQVGDVISIAFSAEDVGSTNFDSALEDSSFYEIYVSRDTAEGKFTGQNAEDEVVKIGGKDYEFVAGYDNGIKTLNMSDEYTLYLDAFGRIFDSEILASSAKLAVLDKFTKASADDYFRALLYTTDGSAKNLEVDTTKVKNLTNKQIAEKVYVTVTGTDDMPIASGAKKDIQGRVVEYKVSSSSGRIIELKFADAQREVTDGGVYYKSTTNSLGNIKFNDATKIIDAIDYVGMTGDIPSYSDLSISSMAALVDGNEYKAFAYGTKNNDGTYPLVLVTEGGGNYTSDTMLAVLAGQPGSGVDDQTQDDIYTITAFYGGEKEVKLVVNDDYTAVASDGSSMSDDDILNMNKGDVIVFAKDGSGNIKSFDVIASASDLGLTDKYSSFLSKAFAQTTEYTFGAGFNNWTGKWVKDNADGLNYSKEITRVVFGPVIDNNTTYFTLGSIGSATKESVLPYLNKNTKIDYSGLFTDLQKEDGEGGVIDVDLSDSTNVYVYDFSKSSSNRLGLGGTADLMALSTNDASLCNDGDYVPWDGFTYTAEGATESTVISADDVRSGTVFALVRMVDNEAKDVLVIVGK